jgi:hypothetical protein
LREVDPSLISPARGEAMREIFIEDIEELEAEKTSR